MTRGNPGRVVPLAGGRGRPGRARSGRQSALPAVVPAAAGNPAARILLSQESGHSARVVPGSASTTAGRPPRARARTTTLAPRRPSRLPQLSYPVSPNHLGYHGGTAPARARVAPLPAPPGAPTNPSTPALTPAAPETGPGTDISRANVRADAGLQGAGEPQRVVEPLALRAGPSSRARLLAHGLRARYTRLTAELRRRRAAGTRQPVHGELRGFPVLASRAGRRRLCSRLARGGAAAGAGAGSAEERREPYRLPGPALAHFGAVRLNPPHPRVRARR